MWFLIAVHYLYVVIKHSSIPYHSKCMGTLFWVCCCSIGSKFDTIRPMGSSDMDAAKEGINPI